jgi:hypothetical protein
MNSTESGELMSPEKKCEFFVFVWHSNIECPKTQ